MAKTDSLTAAELRRIVHYNPFTGVFTRRSDSHSGRWKAGSVMGGIDKANKYIRICINGILYKAEILDGGNVDPAVEKLTLQGITGLINIVKTKHEITQPAKV